MHCETLKARIDSGCACTLSRPALVRVRQQRPTNRLHRAQRNRNAPNRTANKAPNQSETKDKKPENAAGATRTALGNKTGRPQSGPRSIRQRTWSSPRANERTRESRTRRSRRATPPIRRQPSQFHKVHITPKEGRRLWSKIPSAARTSNEKRL
jgi:hypothetical protein